MEKDAKSFKVYDAATGKYKQTVPEKKRQLWRFFYCR